MLKRAYYLSKGTICYNVALVSGLTIGTTGSIIYTSSLIILNSANLLFNIDGVVDEWAENKRCQSRNVISRGVFRGVDFVSRLTFGTVGFILKNTAKLPFILGTKLLATDVKIRELSLRKIGECVDKLNEIGSTMPRPDRERKDNTTERMRKNIAMLQLV